MLVHALALCSLTEHNLTHLHACLDARSYLVRLLVCSSAASDTAASHGKPLPEAECMVCMDDLEADTYFEYKSCDKGGTTNQAANQHQPTSSLT